MTAPPEARATTAAAVQPVADNHNPSTGVGNGQPAPPLITCPGCRGRGQVVLPHPLLVTLGLLRVAGRATAGDLARMDAAGVQGKQVGVTAFNNRLEDLRRLGLVDRPHKRGKAWVYVLVEPT